jgi:hypothetical protein
MRPGLSRSGLGRAGLTESADSDQQLDALLVCVECGAEADEDAQGWRMYRADVPQQGDNEPGASGLATRSARRASSEPAGARGRIPGDPSPGFSGCVAQTAPGSRISTTSVDGNR